MYMYETGNAWKVLFCLLSHLCFFFRHLEEEEEVCQAEEMPEIMEVDSFPEVSDKEERIAPPPPPPGS